MLKTGRGVGLDRRNFSLGIGAVTLTAALTGCAGSKLAENAMPADQQIAADRPVGLIYVRANNCSYCRSWENGAERRWLASDLRRDVSYIRLDFFTFRDITTTNVWGDFVWIRDELGLKRGTPRWIVFRGDQILEAGYGTNVWRRGIVPAVERAVA